ncbi:hypothetical protein HNR07_004344 [Nocardiopsis metallicus]|uniref:Uncharacterized protein n=1 Tax=Nocardiopsis metallicus TaxID=179819 RepID=A0A840WNM8_9ACTN|nr:hypothetical protein [Nocardiopsis metallicus]
MVDQRAATILFGCCGVSVVAGALTLLAAESWPVAILAAGAAFGGALPLLNSVVEDDAREKQTGKDG